MPTLRVGPECISSGLYLAYLLGPLLSVMAWLVKKWFSYHAAFMLHLIQRHSIPSDIDKFSRLHISLISSNGIVLAFPTLHILIESDGPRDAS